MKTNIGPQNNFGTCTLSKASKRFMKKIKKITLLA